MQSTFSSIEIGKRSLVAHNQAMTTAGHNISNASTEGYSRQRVEMEQFDAIYLPGLNREETAGQIGQGVTVQSVRRLRDELLDQRIVAQTNSEGYWQTRDNYVLMLEQIYNEPDESSMRTRMDQFWDSWQELSVYPDSRAARQAVLSRGETLVDSIHQRFASLDGVKKMVDGDVVATVKQVNTLTKQIAAANEQIVKIKAMGDNPNDLLDKRDLLVEKLSSLINITVSQQDPDEYVVHTNGFEIVQGSKARSFELKNDIETDGVTQVIWPENGEQAFFEGGKLGALLEIRDVDIREEMQHLDSMTLNFVDMVNDIHRNGVSPNGSQNLDFFTNEPFVANVDGVYDRNGDGEMDSTFLFRISGNNTLDARDLIGLEGVLTLSGAQGNVNVPYYSTDRVEDVISRINNSGAEVTAHLDNNGRLILKGTTAADPGNPDFVIRHLEDSGRFLNGYAGVLAGSGAGNAFDWENPQAVATLAQGEGINGHEVEYSVSPTSHPAAWIQIRDEIKNDVLSIASGFPGPDGRVETGDGSLALAVASIRNNRVMIGSMTTFDDYFADTVTNIGLKGQQAERALETQTAIMTELRNMRDSISGVNIDEELSDIIKFQHGYNAAARFIATYNDMLDTVINRLGV